MVEVTDMSLDLVTRVPEWERQAEVFERKARALRQMAEAVRVLNGDADRLFGVDEPRPVGTNQYPTREGPRGRDAVRRIVEQRPGEWLVKEIKRVNRENGWPSSDSNIETAVSRMARGGEAVKVPGRKGLYRFGVVTLTPPEIAEDAGEEVRAA
jgi:hypothetical protein